MSTPPISLGAVNVEAEDPGALAGFWATVTGGSAATHGDTSYLPAAWPGGFAMFFHPLPGPRPERSSMRLDLTVPWGERTNEVERLVAVGASWRWDVLEEVPHVRWTTLSDPEGNLFCVAEHPPATS